MPVLIKVSRTAFIPHTLGVDRAMALPATFRGWLVVAAMCRRARADVFQENNLPYLHAAISTSRCSPPTMHWHHTTTTFRRIVVTPPLPLVASILSGAGTPCVQLQTIAFGFVVAYFAPWTKITGDILNTGHSRQLCRRSDGPSL